MAALERDARTTNRMKPHDRIVHRRLEEWGRWSAECRNPSVQTPIARMMEMGLMGAGAESAPIVMPESIEEIDAAVATLPKLEEKVIRRYYLHWEPSEVTAKVMRITVRDLQRTLERARLRIGVTLDLNARHNRGFMSS